MTGWQQVAFPYLDEEMPLLDAVLQRAKAQGVRSVMCDGEVIYADGKFTKVDRDGALRALHEDLQKALGDDEVERRKLSKTPRNTRRTIAPARASDHARPAGQPEHHADGGRDPLASVPGAFG
jgi:ribosomal protein S21